MTLIKISFKRTVTSKIEYGIFIEPSDVIIDSKGQVVKGLVYHFNRMEFDFCISLENLLKN